MKINFKKIEAQTSFEGAKQTFDVAETVGNEMMYNGSILLDIGFEDLVREIYYSKDAVEIPEQYCKALELVVKNSRLIAAVKRAVINQLNVIQPSKINSENYGIGIKSVQPACRGGEESPSCRLPRCGRCGDCRFAGRYREPARPPSCRYGRIGGRGTA